jgi:hypothetical protein
MRILNRYYERGPWVTLSILLRRCLTPNFDGRDKGFPSLSTRRFSLLPPLQPSPKTTIKRQPSRTAARFPAPLSGPGPSDTLSIFRLPRTRRSAIRSRKRLPIRNDSLLGQKGAWPTGSSISRTSPAVKPWVAGTAPSSRSEALPLHSPHSLAAGERNAHHDESDPTLHTIHVDGAAAFNLLSISRPCLCPAPWGL